MNDLSTVAFVKTLRREGEEERRESAREREREGGREGGRERETTTTTTTTTTMNYVPVLVFLAYRHTQQQTAEQRSL